MDKETYENITEGAKFEAIVNSEAYRELSRIIQTKILDLQSVRNIPSNLSADQVVIDIKARNAAIDILIETLRDIEGRAEQHESNKTLIEGYIINV